MAREDIKIGDLVRITTPGLWNLNSPPEGIGLVTALRPELSQGAQLAYVMWNSFAPRPINVRWLEVFNGDR